MSDGLSTSTGKLCPLIPNKEQRIRSFFLAKEVHVRYYMLDYLTSRVEESPWNGFLLDFLDFVFQCRF